MQIFSFVKDNTAHEDQTRIVHIFYKDLKINKKMQDSKQITGPYEDFLFIAKRKCVVWAHPRSLGLAQMILCNTWCQKKWQTDEEMVRTSKSGLAFHLMYSRELNWTEKVAIYMTFSGAPWPLLRNWWWWVCKYGYIMTKGIHL